MSTTTAASRGRVEAVSSPAQQSAAAEVTNTGEDVVSVKNSVASDDVHKQATLAAEKEKQDQPAFDDAAAKKYFADNGIEFGSLDELKEKLKPAAAQPTPEEIESAKRSHEKRMLDLYIARGGTPENFVAIKELMDADVTIISKTALHKSLLETGLDEEEAEAVGKQMFLEQTLENIEQDTDESDAEFDKRKAGLEKKIAAGGKVLQSLGIPLIQKAKNTYEALDKEIKSLDAEEVEETQLSTQINTELKAFSRELKIDLGEVNGKAVAPVSITVDEPVFDNVKEILKDAKSRDAFFYKDGKLNVQNMINVLVRNAALESAVKSSFVKGQSRQVEIFKSQFPNRTGAGIGVGGASTKTGQSGSVSKAGAVQRV